MNNRKITRTGGALAVAAALSASLPAAAADWSDASVSYRVSNSFMEPTNARKISKNILGFTYVNGYKYGGNFLNVEVLKSDSNDPPAGGGGGAQEAYLVYSHTLSLGKTTGSPSFKFGPVRDVGITAGIDLNSKNDAFAPRVRKFKLGPTFSFDVPGFLDTSLLYYKEHNHNGIVGRNVSFDATWNWFTAWGIPVEAINAKFNGFLSVTGKKGKDGFGAQTAQETLSRAYIMFDAGKLMGKKDTFLIGPGVEYWRNKFGSNAAVGADYTAWQLAAEFHF